MQTSLAVQGVELLYSRRGRQNGEKMNIIIVGCGKVGETLAEQLGDEGNNVVVVDLSAAKVKEISERLDIMGVVGNGATYTTLKEAGVNSAELLIAVTESDELNLLCCTVAQKSSKCRVIARVRNPEYRTELDYLKNELGLAMVINPEFAAAEEMARVLRFPAATHIDTFAKGKVELLKFKLAEDNKIIGMSVWEIISKLKCDILVCTVERGDEAFIANGNFVFEGGDLISIIATPKKAADFFKKIEHKSNTIKDIIAVGAGNITHYLAETLKKSGITVKVIDNNLEKCEYLSSVHEDAIVINGDESDQEFLIEQGIENCDAFVALTDNDEENILLSLFAKSVSDAKIVTKINRSEYDDIVKHLDFDTAVYPKNITSDMIVRYVRAMRNSRGSNVENMYSLILDKVEATEFLISEGSSVVGKTLSELQLKKDVLIAAILRGRSVIIPHGHDVIAIGDAVVVVSKILGLHSIQEILK